ncbi:MAG: PaaI family thioesterase [Pseudomonadales bacterium]|nr:PaaI family thioesterase [Pseudomonadales bacterium]
MSEVIIPEGFVEARYAPFSTHVGPFHYKRETNEDGSVSGWVGLPLKDHHIGGNQRGHGGLLLTLLDEAMGMTAAINKDEAPVVTLSMQTSFLAATLPGEFLMAVGKATKITNSVAFIEGQAWCGDTLVGTANGVWKFLNKPKQS